MPLDDLVVGGRYRLIETIGRGGMGAVWRAHDERLQRPVAVKRVEVPAGLAADEQALVRARVMREARAAARIDHPGSVTVFDVLEDEDMIDIVMELVEAPSLGDVVHRQGPLGVAEAANVGIELLDTLQAAHRQRVVHRDVKPGNILVLAGGRVRLTDFGVASLVDHPSLTTSGRIVGSPAYMAPEQALGRPAGPMADLWGLGATLYFAVEGHPPFERAGSIPTLTAVVNDEPAPPVRAGSLAPVLAQLLRKDPEQRPSIEEARAQLAAVAAGASPAAAATATTAATSTAVPPAAARPQPDADPTVAGRPTAAHPPPPVRPRPTRSGRNWTRATRTRADEQRAAIGSAAAQAAAARVAARGRTALQDAAGTTGDLRVTQPQPAPSRWSPGGGPIMLGALAVLAVLAVLATWAVRRGSDDGTAPGDEAAASTTSPPTGVSAGEPTPRSGPSASAAASTTTSAAPGGTSTTAAATTAGGPVTVPAGWTPYADPTTGYRIAHPPGWTIRRVDDVRVDFVDPATGAYMRVDWLQPPGDSAVGAWQAFAPRFAAQNPGYQEIRIEPTTFRGLEAAIWEFRYGEGGRLHAVDLGMISGRYGFALNFQAPEAHWNALQPIRQGFEASFVPAS